MGGVSRKSLESGLKKVTVWTGLKSTGNLRFSAIGLIRFGKYVYKDKEFINGKGEIISYEEN